jgi:hypothetical protein
VGSSRDVFGKSSGAKDPFLVTWPLAEPGASAFDSDEPVDPEARLVDLLALRPAWSTSSHSSVGRWK